MGATWIMGDPNNKGGYEVKYSDPTGVILDISVNGWAGAQKSPGAADNGPFSAEAVRPARHTAHRHRRRT